MLGIIEYGNTDILKDFVFVPPKYNRMWGADYMLMDSKSFMGGKGGAGYEQVIDMFQKIWNVKNYRLFSGF
jgi:hypothetical protein